MQVDLPDDRRALRDMARDFLLDRCPPDRARALDEAGEFPHDLFRQMGALGWQGIPFAERFGGADGDAIDEAIVVEQLGRALGPLASAFVISVLTCGKTIRDLGTDEQRERWLPPIISGESLISFALTEPDAGSDAAAISSRATRTENGWVLNGQKIFCTGASISDRMLVMMRTGEGRSKNAIGMFVVETDTPGVTIQTIPKLGLHPYPSCMIFFDDVQVDDDRRLGDPSAGWRHIVSSLNRERLAISAMCTGMAQAALDVAVPYAAERNQFGVPIDRFDAVRHLLARMVIMVEGARALMLRSAWLEAAGEPSTLAASLAKIRTTDASVDAARLGMQVLGGYSYTMEYPMQRFLRDALIHPIAGGSNEIQRNIVAQELLSRCDDAHGPSIADGHPLRAVVDRAADEPDAGLALAARYVVDQITDLEGERTVVLAPDDEQILRGFGLQATKKDDGWTLRGHGIAVGDGPALLLAPTPDGAVLVAVDVLDQDGSPHVQLHTTAAAGEVVAELDDKGADQARTALREAGVAVLVGIAGTGLGYLASALSDAGDGDRTDRWAGQAAKHRLADLALAHEVARLELCRAVEATTASAHDLHAAIGLHEALTAARAAVEDTTRVARARGDYARVQWADTAASALDTVDALCGGRSRLRDVVATLVIKP